MLKCRRATVLSGPLAHFFDDSGPTTEALSRWAITILALGAVAAALRAVAPDYTTVRAGRLDAAISNPAIAANVTDKLRDVVCHLSSHHDAGSGSRSVLGDFDRNNTITYQGVRAEMVRQDGKYWMKVTGVDGHTQQLEIVRTVGSRRIQQYLTKTGDTWYRAPIAYDLVQKRWMHLNGSFFFPDGSDYNQQRRGVECELCFLPQRESAARSRLG